MKILVLSDSHGAVERMRQAVTLAEPQQLLFLGDCLRDADALHRAFPQLPMTAVPGNCDPLGPDAPERLIELGGKRILMMHGHTRSVKYSPLSAVCAAREYGADILLFGHTHQALTDRDGALWIMNPGSVGDRHAPTYGVITVDGGDCCCAVCRLP